MKAQWCKLKEKLDNDTKLSKEDVKTIMEIVKKEINFLIKNNIVMSPKNYERWFYLFCTVLEQKKDFNELDLLGLYKQLYKAPYDEIKEKLPENEEIIDKRALRKVVKIADDIETKLAQVIQTMDNHNHSIEQHKQHIASQEESINQESSIKEMLQKILNELESLKKDNEQLTKEIQTYRLDISKLKRELTDTKVAADIDFLTGLVNRRRFERAVMDMLNDYKSRDYPFSLIMFDIDHFKKINDTYGHPMGDEVLKEIALILKTYLRANNIPARIGGEEFAILVPGATEKEAAIIANRLKETIANKTMDLLEDNVSVTASFGVTEAKKDDTLQTLYERVDQALYEAKKSGRNQVVSK